MNHFVALIDKKLQKALEKLRSGDFEDRELCGFIDRAIDDLKKDPECGIKIPQKLIPKLYIRLWGITNLRKYDLPNGWRLLYTIEADSVKIVSVILEWLDHTNYERRFGY